MARTRMSWDWIKDYPIFVYTIYLAPATFRVKIVKGEKGNQNAPGFGPSAPAWKTYVQKKLLSKDDVVRQAFKIAKRELDKESLAGKED